MIWFSLMGLHVLQQNLTLETTLEFFSGYASSVSLNYYSHEWTCIIDFGSDGKFYGKNKYAKVALGNAISDFVEKQREDLSIIDNEVVEELRKVEL